MDVPFVLGPELAMARIPAPTNRRSGWISSALNITNYQTRPDDFLPRTDSQLLPVYRSPTSTGSCWVTSLHHEVLPRESKKSLSKVALLQSEADSDAYLDHPMEDDIVIVPSFSELGEVFACLKEAFSRRVMVSSECNAQAQRRDRLTLGACSV